MAGAYPHVNMQGIKDNSTTNVTVALPAVPRHCPRVWIYSPKGPVGKHFTSASVIASTYGSDAFDRTKQYYTHQNHLVAKLIEAGNSMEIERLVPPDAGPKANITVWLDVLPMTVPLYQRNSDGSYLTDINGNPQPTSPATTTTGYKVKVVVTSTAVGGPAVADSTTFGNKTSMVGDQTSSGITSTRYPIIEWWASSYGAAYNNAGFKLVAPTTSSTVQPLTSVANALGAFMYRLIAIRRDTTTSSPYVVGTINGDSYIDFCLKPNQVRTDTTAQVSLGDIFVNNYNSNTPGYTPVIGDVNGIKVYDSNIATVTALLYATEKNYTGAGSDFSVNPSIDESFKINLFTAKSTSNIPYYSILLNTSDANAVTIGESTNLFLGGGSDGSVASGAGGAYFDSLVATSLTKYSDTSTAEYNVEYSPGNMFYDTGFALTTKYAFSNPISLRKDTVVHLSTYTVGGATLTQSDENSIAAALTTRLRLQPESTVFGTGTCRGIVLGRHGTDIQKKFVGNLQLPALLFQIARYNALLMGAENGVWNANYLYDNGEYGLNMITDFNNLNIGFTGVSAASSAWTNCLNVPQPKNYMDQFIPVIRTVTADETSVLLTNFNVYVCAQVETIGRQAWVTYSGSTRYTSAQFISQVTNWWTNNLNASSFANIATFTPVVTITGYDQETGYSWSTKVKVALNNAKTNNTFWIEAYRQSDTTTTTS